MFNISQKFIILPSQDKASKHIYPTRFIKLGVQGFMSKRLGKSLIGAPFKFMQYYNKVK